MLPDLLGVSDSWQRRGSVERMAPVIVLNGGSSSGKTSIARCLQRLLGSTWMTLGVDDLVRALPGSNEVDDLIEADDAGGTVGTQGNIVFGPDGSVTVGDDFRRAEASWYAGLATIARCGTGLIIDEVFLGGERPVLAGPFGLGPSRPAGGVGRGPLQPRDCRGAGEQPLGPGSRDGSFTGHAGTRWRYLQPGCGYHCLQRRRLCEGYRFASVSPRRLTGGLHQPRLSGVSWRQVRSQ
jgi:hypothetical protein